MRRVLRKYWEAGQHVTIFAPTGAGKTYLWTRCLAPLWSHTLTLDLKVDDPDNRAHARALGAKRVRRYPPPEFSRFWREDHDPYPDKHYWLEPPEAEIKGEFVKGLHHVFYRHKEAIKVVYIDEFKIFAARPEDGYGLFPWSNRFLRLARGRGITLISGTQDPWWVGPGGSDLVRQPRWFFIGRTRDEGSLDRYKGISGLPKAVIFDVIPNLGKHEFLMISLDLELMVRFTPPGPKARRRKEAVTPRQRQTHSRKDAQRREARSRLGLPS